MPWYAIVDRRTGKVVRVATEPTAAGEGLTAVELALPGEWSSLATYKAQVARLEPSAPEDLISIVKVNTSHSWWSDEREVAGDLRWLRIQTPAYFFERVREERVRFQGQLRPFSLLMFETDGSNRALTEMALIVRATVRRADVVSVIEEKRIVVLMPETDANGCRAVYARLTPFFGEAPRLRATLATYPIGVLD